MGRGPEDPARAVIHSDGLGYLTEKSSLDDLKEPKAFETVESWPPELPVNESRKARTSFWLNFFASICAGFSVVACIKASHLLSGPYPITNDCDNTDSITTTERQFQINIRVLGGLSFAQAKIIDLAWDVGVAQGGRLLHGWILYQVACKAITWSLERSSMPYSFLLNLFFWPDSIVSLWSSVRHLFRNLFGRKRPDVLLAVVLIAYAIAHVLFFGALWSAATGYQNPGTAVFAMPDGSWVTKDNSTLRLCWLVDSQRLGNLLPADGVVLGPRFGSIFQSFSDLDLEGRPESMWDVYPNIDQSEDVEDFHDIFSYARSSYTMRSFLEDHGYSQSGPVFTWNDTAVYYANRGGVNSMGFPTLHLETPRDPALGEGAATKPLIVNGWQFMGMRQGPSTSSEETVSVTYNRGDETEQSHTMQLIRSSFHRNDSALALAGPQSIPYNSTLWFNGSKIALEAPFLGFRNCSWSASPLGECLCYKGSPLMEDFRADSRKLCIGGGRYIWGFSRSLVFVGVALETVWCYVCIVLLLLATQQSELVRRGRSTAGVLRTILDISESLNRDLGTDTMWHTEKQLWEKLSCRPPVRYVITETDGLDARVELVSLPDGTQRGRRRRSVDSRA